ncbi:uncharacterized protein LOC107813288 isoform X1 [Nicotiana tabacum]|uniref:Uncharacterized protein LOC107813288 isoform X1 n=1 Tax=Nicotiana tabacum TaxID=4097 RepID=A0A1S4BYW1_TOBAC|nr:PREDICTED: uncharacterized protein LOC107813288 isoform X1 [Nicotiana tabacum]
MPFPEKWNIPSVAQVPNAVPRLKEWVEGIVLQSPYSERSWRELSKGRWEAHSHGLSKDVTLRPPSGGEKFSAESPASSSPCSEKKKPRRRLVRKSKESIRARAPSSDALYRLRDESEEEGEAFDLMARVSLQLEGQRASELKRGEAGLPQVREADKETVAEASRDMGNTPKKAHGVIDITESPSFTESMYNGALTVMERLNKEAHGADDPFCGFFVGVDSTATEDVTGLGDLEVQKKNPSSGTSRPSSSPKLINRFPAPSVDPDRVLSTPVGMASYLRCLVTEKDQDKMNELDTPCLFNDAQQVLNRASVLHHETFLRYRDELNQLEAEVRGLTEKRNTYKLLSEQREGEAKSL